MFEVKSNIGSLRIDQLPDKCPFCHKSIIPKVIYSHLHNEELEVFFSCPNLNCQMSFLGYYVKNLSASHYYFDYKVSTGFFESSFFSKIIKDISPCFEKIYNESFYAEQNSLLEICGVGYRKALEFLIKDYSIHKNITEKDKIELMPLGNCINSYVSDDRIKTVAKRAVWLGNDETHYIRKWEGKNLEDLKKLLDLTIHWIELEELTESFINEMPDN